MLGFIILMRFIVMVILVICLVELIFNDDNDELNRLKRENKDLQRKIELLKSNDRIAKLNKETQESLERSKESLANTIRVINENKKKDEG